MLSVNQFVSQPQDRLFNTEAFFRLHAPDNACFFQWVLKGRAVMCLHASEVNPGCWRSPRRGTYGGVSFFADVSVQELEAFLVAVLEYLQRQGVERLEILLPPMAHAAERAAEQFFVLRSLGFTESLCDANYAIDVDTRPLLEHLNYANRKRLNKCQREGFAARMAEPTELPAIYQVIARNRLGKGYPMTMTLAQLTQMQVLFPEQVQLFACHAAQQMVASAVCLRVSPEVLYVFYWGDEAAFSQFSPITLLASAIYEYCQQQAIALLDIGTASADGQANHGLIRFKRGLGCEASLKFRLEKTLES